MNKKKLKGRFWRKKNKYREENFLNIETFSFKEILLYIIHLQSENEKL